VSLGLRGERSGEREGKRQESERRTPLGQALVEFALVVPIMILIFGGLVQFAFIFERQIGIENAVRDGARRAATFETLDAPQAVTNGAFVWDMVFAAGGLMRSNVQGYDPATPPVHDATVCYRTQLDAAGNDSVMVKVSEGYRHPLWLPLVTQLLDPLDGTVDGALNVDTSSEFQVQNAATTPSSVGATPVCTPP
jgi:Flp pilus assembly protein TadG